MITLVERELELGLVLSPERSMSVSARLTYRVNDPYAVRITFHAGSDTPITWTFARDLLIEGVFRPCGEGDVRVWPTKADGQSVLCIALISPDGDALLQGPASAVSSWLERTLRVVPPGHELEVLGMDEALDELLTPGPSGDDAARLDRMATDEPGDDA
jgi:hypothetical protein